MKFLTEYRNPDLVKFYLSEIEKTVTKALEYYGNLWWTNAFFGQKWFARFVARNVRMIHGRLPGLRYPDFFD